MRARGCGSILRADNADPCSIPRSPHQELGWQLPARHAALLPAPPSKALVSISDGYSRAVMPYGELSRLGGSQAEYHQRRVRRNAQVSSTFPRATWLHEGQSSSNR
jgi:hypothetical protein